jgi:hypothetical protein
MTAQKNTLVRRALRRFTLGSGPLKRRSDRVQALARFVVALSFLVAPMLAVAATTATSTHLQAVADHDAAERTATRAVLLEDAPATVRADRSSGAYAVISVPARAVWSVPGGTTREGTVLVRPGTPVGTALPAWVDRDGNLTRPPLGRAGIPSSAAVMGAVALVGVPLGTWTLYAVLCLALDAHRERRWAQDWAAVEPDWHSRLI